MIVLMSLTIQWTEWIVRRPDAGTNNHDICFAFSDDGGTTWKNGAHVG